MHAETGYLKACPPSGDGKEHSTKYDLIVSQVTGIAEIEQSLVPSETNCLDFHSKTIVRGESTKEPNVTTISRKFWLSKDEVNEDGQACDALCYVVGMATSTHLQHTKHLEAKLFKMKEWRSEKRFELVVRQ